MYPLIFTPTSPLMVTDHELLTDTFEHRIHEHLKAGEVQALRDNDPDQHATQALAALSLAWMANDDLQLDILGAAGLNGDTPDARVYAGISRRF